MPLLSVVEGWTGLLGPFTLRVNGTALDLTGLTVTLVLRNAAGVLRTPGGAVAVLNQTTYPGQVTYAPVAGDFTFDAGGYTNDQMYRMHWKVVDGAGKIVFFPNDVGDEVNVYRA